MRHLRLAEQNRISQKLLKKLLIDGLLPDISPAAPMKLRLTSLRQFLIEKVAAAQPHKNIIFDKADSVASKINEPQAKFNQFTLDIVREIIDDLTPHKKAKVSTAQKWSRRRSGNYYQCLGCGNCVEADQNRGKCESCGSRNWLACTVP